MLGIKKFLKIELHSEKLAFKLPKKYSLMIKVYRKSNGGYVKKSHIKSNYILLK